MIDAAAEVFQKNPPRAIRRSKRPTCFSTAGTVLWTYRTDEDRRALTDLLLRHNAEVQQFFSAIKARPVQAVRVHDPAEARRRLGLLGNVRS